MKNFILFSALFFSGVVCSQAHAAFQTTPIPMRTPTAAEDAQRSIRRQQESNRRYEALKGSGQWSRSTRSQKLALQSILNTYRKPSKEESKLLTPDKEDLKKYTQFLRQPETGLIKLIADQGCAEHTSVLNVSGECLKYSMPGGGASYSFRTENYRIRRLSDITFKDNSFQSSGILAHALLVNIGDVALEHISLQTAGLKFLTDFETTDDFERARKIDLRLIEGIQDSGFTYKRVLEAAENTTYVLRSIAYRGNHYRAVQGLVYDELDFDRRKDITVAFRIIRRDDDSVTILWKRLSEKNSPKVKKNGKDDSDVKENKLLAKKSEYR